MKWLYIAMGILLGVPLLFVGAIYAASELGGEVVVLHRESSDGSVDRVRIWIVEDDSGTWIEHGSPDAEWIQRLAREPVITLERGGAASSYRASADPGSHDRYHSLRRQKYGFAAQLVALTTGDVETCEGTPVRVGASGP